MSETNEISRRALLRNIAISATLSAGITAEAAQHVHQAAADEKKAGAAYKPKVFSDHEWQTLRRLCEIIVPGSLEGGAPEFIDVLAAHNPQLAAIYTGGIGWLDRQMERHSGKAFLDATPQQQTAMLDLIAYRKNQSPDLAPGIRFFDWVRRMTVDAYYTSAAGIKELGYMGNTAVAKFQVPEEAIQYALKRSGLG